MSRQDNIFLRICHNWSKKKVWRMRAKNFICPSPLIWYQKKSFHGIANSIVFFSCCILTLHAYDLLRNTPSLNVRCLNQSIWQRMILIKSWPYIPNIHKNLHFLPLQFISFLANFSNLWIKFRCSEIMWRVFVWLNFYQIWRGW